MFSGWVTAIIKTKKAVLQECLHWRPDCPIAHLQKHESCFGCVIFGDFYYFEPIAANGNTHETNLSTGITYQMDFGMQ